MDKSNVQPIKDEVETEKLSVPFKKPVLVGKIGKSIKKLVTITKVDDTEETALPRNEEEIIKGEPEPLPEHKKSVLVPAVLLKEQSVPIPYKEPKWSGLPPSGSGYSFEVLKSGTILETIDLMSKTFHVFGRLANCDIVMAHPTISRHHAVIQYRTLDEETEEGPHPSGIYVYDLGSTHGTFVNKTRVQPKHYVRLRVGHVLKLGCSSRNYILQGPELDCEEESELSITEMKEKRERLLLERQLQLVLEKKEREAENKKKEENGINWGMADDAEEETDLSENPFAVTTNEELYLDDPKKTLRGYFEREGYDLEYNCEERGVGTFVCRVELPIEDAMGRPITTEVVHKGKKKEAVVQCALEACRVIDRHGLLRQATQESRKRKSRNWQEEDYYSSDEDPFLDRTGAVERKRKERMRRMGADAEKDSTRREKEKPLTYDDLIKKCADIEVDIKSAEVKLHNIRNASNCTNKKREENSEEEDALDQFMSTLGKAGPTMAEKAEISNTKMTIQKLKTELSKTQRLADIARPAQLPELVKVTDEPIKKLSVKMAANSVVYGKRLKLKNDATITSKSSKTADGRIENYEEFVEEVDSDDDITEKEVKDRIKNETDTNCEIFDSKEDKNNKEVEKDNNNEEDEKEESTKNPRVFGPMRPPENYVVPEDYFDQETDRDLPEISEKN